MLSEGAPSRPRNMAKSFLPLLNAIHNTQILLDVCVCALARAFVLVFVYYSLRFCEHVNYTYMLIYGLNMAAN
jgi:hypothetical protein